MLIQLPDGSWVDPATVQKIAKTTTVGVQAMTDNCVVCGKEFEKLGCAITCGKECSKANRKSRSKAHSKAWRDSPAGKAYNKAWRDSPAGNAYMKAWGASPKVKAAQRRKDAFRRAASMFDLHPVLFSAIIKEKPSE